MGGASGHLGPRRAFRVAVVALVLVSIAAFGRPEPGRADTFSDSSFSTETIATLPPYTVVGLAFAPDGRLFVWQKNGVVRVIKNGALLPTPFIDLSAKVNTYDDRGSWGFAVDPDFVNNGHVYMTYTFENAGNPNSTASRTSRLVRLTASSANPDVANPATETIILGSVGTPPCSAQPPGADCIPADGGSHTLGSVVFAADGTMLVGVGDGSDDNSLSLRAQDLDSVNGKILRINKDGTAPTDNPFYDGTNSVRSKVWLYGVRNPFRFAQQPGSERIVFGDVGWNTWEEINIGLKGANYGWPCYEGVGPLSTFQGDPTSAALPSSAVIAPFHTYNHSQGSAAIGGPFYTASAYPQQYQGNFFFGDYSGNFIKRIVFDANGQPLSVQPFASDVPGPVSMVIGPDGLMYYLSFTTGEVRRIRSNAPSAQATAVPTYGYSPLTVNFSSAGSTNPGGGTLNYSWDFGDGTPNSTEPNPSHTYTSPSPVTVTPRLTVTNSAGYSTSRTLSVTVGSLPPTPTISAPGNGTPVSPGQTVNFQGAATDPDDGALPASALSWTVLLHHNTHEHTFVTGSGSSGSFVAENHGAIGTFAYEVVVTATDSSGLKSSTSVTLPVVADTTPPTTPTNLTAAAAGWSRVDLNWSAATDNAGLAGYRVERCAGAGCSNFTDLGTVSTTAFSDNSVAPLTTYSYRVRAADASGNLGAYSNSATAATEAAPPQPPSMVAGYSFDAGAGATVSDLSGNNNTGTISGAIWTTGKYGGGLNFNGSARVQVPSAPSLDLSSAMTLSAWIQPTVSQSGWKTIIQKQTDAYALNASNGGNLIPGGGGTISGGWQYVSGTSANPVNAWTHLTLTYDGTTLRFYVNGTQVATKATTGTIQTTASPLWIGGNQPYGEFFVGIIDEVHVYNRALSPTEIQVIRDTAIVPTAPDTTAPSNPSGLVATANGAQVGLSWTASTDNVGVARYRVERCQGVGCSVFTEVGAPTGTTFADSGLASSNSYSYRVRAEDSAGNLSDYSDVSSAVTGPAATDTTPPTTPTGVTATVAGPSQINLSWTASADNVGVAGYRIERCQGTNCTNFAQVGTSTTANFASTGLAAGTKYRFRLRAVDAASNLSAYSSIVTATTQAADTTRPSKPATLTATATGASRIDLTWSASTDNVGVTEYRIERCQGSGCSNFAQIATSTTTVSADTTVVAGTTYRYRVRAADAANNVSTYSPVATATTATVTDTTAPSVTSGLTATALSGLVNLSWGAATDNVAVTGYRIERCEGGGCSNFAQIGVTTGTTYSDSPVAPLTTYSYRVRAADASGNLGGYSNTATVTTSTAPTAPTGLVAGYSFDAGAGATVSDLSGNNNTGTISGAIWTTGKYGGGLNFNGSARVQVPSAPSLDLSSAMTLSAWIQPTVSQSGWKTIIQKQTDAYALNASNGGNLIPGGGGTISGGWQYVSGTSANPVNAWTHLTLTYDGTTLRFYVNGTQVATKATTGTIQTTASPLWIGGNQPYGEFFVGIIDEVRVYNRALSPTEIQVIRDNRL